MRSEDSKGTVSSENSTRQDKAVNISRAGVVLMYEVLGDVGKVLCTTAIRVVTYLNVL